MESPAAAKGGGLPTPSGRSRAAMAAANFMAWDATLPMLLAGIRDLIGSGEMDLDPGSFERLRSQIDPNPIGRRFIELIKSSPMGGEAEAAKLKVTSP